MKLNFILLLAISFCSSWTVSAQIKIAPCPFDSADFETPQQKKMWLYDTTLLKDVEYRINYLTALHRNYLPLHHDLKKVVAQKLNKAEKEALLSISELYQTELLKKRAIFLGAEPEFNQNLPIFSHLDWVIIFETLHFYPDVNAILVNPQHVAQPMALTDTEIREKIEQIYTSSNSRFKEKIDKEFHSFLNGMKSLQETEHSNLVWQGNISPEEREHFDWINFLIWCNKRY